MEFIKKNKLALIFTVTGLVAGFLYWKFIVFLSGTCPIKSVWYISTLFGGVIGYLVGSIISDFIEARRKKKEAGVQ
mgnify:CR=1 FL=1